MVRLFIKDNRSGFVHEYGSDRHDSLILSEDGTLHYYNLQNGGGTLHPENEAADYSFCNEDGSEITFLPEDELMINIGGSAHKDARWMLHWNYCPKCGAHMHHSMKDISVESNEDSDATKETLFQWTPIEKGLPKETGNYLFTYEGEILFPFVFVGYLSGKKVIGVLDKDIADHVTAWMPLPEPYDPNK